MLGAAWTAGALPARAAPALVPAVVPPTAPLVRAPGPPAAGAGTVFSAGPPPAVPPPVLSALPPKVPRGLLAGDVALLSALPPRFDEPPPTTSARKTIRRPTEASAISTPLVVGRRPPPLCVERASIS